MIQVQLMKKSVGVKFKHEGRTYDGIIIGENSNSRLYCIAMKKGMKMKRIAKQMQFDGQGNVFISFGKDIKVVVGRYFEVPDKK